MPTPAELRIESHLYVQASRKEDTPHIKQMLAKHALALAQLAEKIERDAGGESKRRETTAPAGAGQP